MASHITDNSTLSKTIFQHTFQMFLNLLKRVNLIFGFTMRLQYDNCKLLWSSRRNICLFYFISQKDRINLKIEKNITRRVQGSYGLGLHSASLAVTLKHKDADHLRKYISLVILS